MPNRIDEVLLDPGDKSVPDPGEAAELFAALPEEISPPKHVGLERWHGRRATRPADGSMWHGASDVVPRSSPRKAQTSLPRYPLLYANVMVIIPLVLINKLYLPHYIYLLKLFPLA
jgi:hypothetical protein